MNILTIEKFLLPLGVALVVASLLLILRKVTFRLLSNWASRTESLLDDAVLVSIRTPSLFWCVGIALYLGLDISEIPSRITKPMNRAIDIALIFSVSVALASLSGTLLKNLLQRTALPIPASGLAHAVLKTTIFVIGALVILSVLGISIAPLLTALGVGGLAVALALKDTLENLFAGVYLLIDKTIRVGDFIRLDTGQEGFVEDIGWRSTKIKLPQNNIVITPNSKLAQSIILNYSLPEKRVAISIPVSVSYESDPQFVEKILLEISKAAAADVSGLLSEPAALVRFSPGFGESSLDLTLTVHGREFTDAGIISHELRKRIFQRFKKEKIEIPYPHRTIHHIHHKEKESNLDVD